MMNVQALRAFLESLVNPLRLSQTRDKSIDDLEEVVQALAPFAEKPLSELSEFLVRSYAYEEAGHWPSSNPPISGQVVDCPTPKEFATRIEEFFKRVVPNAGPMDQSALLELKKLTSVVQLQQLKEIAAAVGVNSTIRKSDQAVAKIFEQLTGRQLESALVETLKDLLIRSRSNANKLAEVLESVHGCTTPTVKKIATGLGVGKGLKGKRELIDSIELHLGGTADVVVNEPATAHSAKSERIEYFVETLVALKEKADPVDGAPEEEIDNELNRLEGEMNRDEALAAAKAFGVKWNIHNKSDAMMRIRERVFERKIMRAKSNY